MSNGHKLFHFATSKMKLFTFLIIIKFIAISSSKLTYKFAPVVKNCPLLLPVETYSQTLIFDMDVHAHPELKTYILQNSLADQSVVLLNVYGSDLDIRVNVTRKFIRTSDNPNVIIITRYLTPKMVDSTLLRFFINSNWSLLYIIVTSDSKFKCKNGTMNPKDFSLLENIMNTLWHKFQIMRVGVIFPYACPKKMVIYTGKKPSTRNLYDRSIKLISAIKLNDLSLAIKKSGEKLADDYPIQASIFYRYPTSIKGCKNLHYYVNFNLNLTDGYCGLDGMVMHDILSHLKFNLSFPEDDKCDNYGYAVPGNVSGTLGCIIRSELDISFNSRFMTLYSDEHIYYLHYVKTDTLCALIRNPGIVPLWQSVFNLFSPLLWVLIGAVLVAIGGIMWAMAMINRTMTGPQTMTLWWYLHNSVITTIVGYSPMKTRTLLILRSSCLLGSIIFLALYQGHLSRVYTTVQRYHKMTTLEQLYSSDITLYTSPSIREIIRQLQAPEDKLQTEFFDRAHVISGDHLGVILQYTHAATVDRKSDASLNITQLYSESDGTPLIDIVDECFYTYYLSYIARSGFPFYKEIKIVTERLNEAGLPSMYYKWTQQMLDIPKPKIERDSDPRISLKIRLRDQSVAFVILFIGTILSVLVFAAEMWKGSRHDSKLYKRRF